MVRYSSLGGIIMKRDYVVYSDKLNKDIRCVVLSDIHYIPGMKLDFLYNQLEKIKSDVPDYVIILGDLINDGLYDVEELKELRKWLYDLSKVGCKVISILGNHEQLTQKYSDDWEECYNPDYVNMLKNYDNFTLLENATLETGDIMFGGTRFSGDYYDKRKEPISEYKKGMKNAVFSPDKLNILLDHSPVRSFDSKVIGDIKSLNDVDLVLSGHIHNGCIPNYVSGWFPGNFGLIDPYMQLFPKNARGMKQITDNTVGIAFAPVTTFTGYQGLFQKLNFMYPPVTQQVLVKKNK